MTNAADAITERYNALKPVLDEQSLRRFSAAEAASYGHGGVTLLSGITGLARSTIDRGIEEIRAGSHAGEGRIRRPGGGRKPVEETNPALPLALKKLVEPDTRGDPVQPLLWISKSTGHLSKALKKLGYTACPNVVGKLLRQMNYSLQANSKTREGKQNPDRDAQFNYINEQAKKFMAAGDPVISVDTKKKELVGDFKNNGREWHPKGSPEIVRTHDFPDKKLGKAAPYGIYD